MSQEAGFSVEEEGGSSFSSSFRPFPLEPALSRAESPIGSSPLTHLQQQQQSPGMVTMHNSDYAHLDSLGTSNEGMEMMVGAGNGGDAVGNYETSNFVDEDGELDDGVNSLLDQLGLVAAEVKLETETPTPTPPTMPTIFEMEGSAAKKRKHQSPFMPAFDAQSSSSSLTSSSAPSPLSSASLPSTQMDFSAGNDPPRLYAQPLPGPRPPTGTHTFAPGAPTLQSTTAATAMALFPQTSSTSSSSTVGLSVNPAHSQLLHIHQMQQQHKEQFDKMRHIQRQLMHQPEMNTYKMIDAEQKQLRQKIDEEIQTLHKINRTHILDPQDLHKYTFLRQELEIQLQQLELYMRELQLLLQPPAPRWYAIHSRSHGAWLMDLRQHCLSGHLETTLPPGDNKRKGNLGTESTSSASHWIGR